MKLSTIQRFLTRDDGANHLEFTLTEFHVDVTAQTVTTHDLAAATCIWFILIKLLTADQTDLYFFDLVDLFH